MSTRLTIVAAQIAALSLVAALGAHALAPTAIPADQAGAAGALENSPRHGEWVDIAMPGGAPLKTWVVYPERGDEAPVVLVIHEIFGLSDWVRAVADQLAAEGFVAVAPDFLSGLGPDGGGTSSMESGAVREKIRTLTPEMVAARLDAARQWAIAQPSTSDKSACIGFCWGGSQSFAYAAAQPALDGAVVFYGSAPTDSGALATIECPVLGLYGGDDARVTSTVEPTKKAMADAGKEYTVHVYDGAGHGFLRQQQGREANMDAATRSWQTTLEFLRARTD